MINCLVWLDAKFHILTTFSVIHFHIIVEKKTRCPERPALTGCLLIEQCPADDPNPL